MNTRAAMMIFKRFLAEIEGGDAVEYVLIGSVLVSGIMMGGSVFAGSVNNLYTWVAAVVTAALSGGRA